MKPHPFNWALDIVHFPAPFKITSLITNLYFTLQRTYLAQSMPFIFHQFHCSRLILRFTFDHNFLEFDVKNLNLSTDEFFHFSVLHALFTPYTLFLLYWSFPLYYANVF